MQIYTFQKVSSVLRFGLLCVLFTLLSPRVFCQFTDNFSDGDFTANPVWSGDTGKFVVNTSFQLQLNGGAMTDTASISTPNTSVNNTEWNFWLKLSFSPSASNYARVYLMSDQPNLEGALNGYYIRLGEALALDGVDLYKQTGMVSTRIFHGIDGHVAQSTNTLRIKVTRDNSGNWNVVSDTTGGVNFLPEGAPFLDNTFTTSAFSGVSCYYTSSNSTKFYFDDFYCGPIVVDVTPPSIISLNIISATQLDVQFSEGVDLTTSQILTNYSVNTGIGNPSSAIRDATDLTLVHLTFTNTFASSVTYTLTVNGVNDFSNNTLVNGTSNFTWYVPQQNDIVINELMADPDPQVSNLPDYEYIELFNRKNFSINLSGWTLTVGNYTRVIPDVTILADSFLILTTTTAAPQFQVYGTSVGVVSFPALTNTGAEVTIRDQFSHIISTVTYSDSWYRDAVKILGGWSLEQIDPANPCAGMTNWIASNDLMGGTPGKRNSVFASNPDITPPRVLSVSVITPTQVRVHFSESVDSTAMGNNSLYTIDHSIGSPSSVHVIAPDYTSALLNLGSALSSGIIYNLTTGTTITDCAGNPAGTSTPVAFALYDAKANDIVINEIMADPDPPVGLPNAEWVELYNRSLFPINLFNWTISTSSTTKAIPDATIQAGGYLILTDDNILSSFTIYGNVQGIAGFPSPSNSGTTLTISDSLHHIINTVTYNDNWYQSTLKKNGGWSLEMIDPANPCAGESNWRASVDNSGGTPGRINSIYASNTDLQNPSLMRVGVMNNQIIKLFFSEPIDSTTLLNVNNYTIDNGIGNPLLVTLIPPTYDAVTLNLATAISPGIIYHITVANTIKDCAGNTVSSGSTARFALPQPADSFDVVINEILFNPLTNGYDFVELYNRSQKIIDLKNYYIANTNPDGTLADIKNISGEGYLLFPGEYVALTQDPFAVKSQYYTTNPDGFIAVPSMPSYNVDGGGCAFVDLSMLKIDQFIYTASMHFPLLNDPKGVSLERINFDRPTQDSTNWHSASQTCGFATPAYQNSQYSPGETSDNNLTVQPEIFSPDEDGYNDVVNLNYHFDTPGFTGNITIYDARGRVVRSLMKNTLLGTDGTISWDGITDRYDKASIGIYVIYFEAFDLKGTVKHIKKSCVLAGKFN